MFKRLSHNVLKTHTVKEKVDEANAKMFLPHEVYARLKSKGLLIINKCLG